MFFGYITIREKHPQAVFLQGEGDKWSETVNDFSSIIFANMENRDEERSKKRYGEVF